MLVTRRFPAVAFIGFCPERPLAQVDLRRRRVEASTVLWLPSPQAAIGIPARAGALSCPRPVRRRSEARVPTMSLQYESDDHAGDLRGLIYVFYPRYADTALRQPGAKPTARSGNASARTSALAAR